MPVTLIAALGRNRVIGRDGAIPWHLPEDLARFKRRTTGHVVVMGRATYESIGRPLPGRTTVVLTTDRSWDPGTTGEQVRVAHDLEEALALARSIDEEVYVAGGGVVYAAALPYADRLELTYVDAEPVGDAYFPELDPLDWIEVAREPSAGCVTVTSVRRCTVGKADPDSLHAR